MTDTHPAPASTPIPQAAGDAPAPPWVKYVAMLTGVLAAVAGFLTVRSANLSNEAIYESNQAVLSQSRASDKWAEYQAASIKARVVETQLTTLSAGSPAALTAAGDALRAESRELRDRQPPLKKDAQDLEAKRDEQLAAGRKRLAEKDLLGYAGVAVQLGIALAAVAAMTRRRDAFAVGILVGAAGVGIMVFALVKHHLMRG